MKFAAFHRYTPDKEKIAAARPKHREYLQGLLAAGKLVLAGPFLDDSGALIVYEAADAEAATQIIKGDPFFAAGVFAGWELRPWKTVFGNHSLLPDGFQP